MDVATTDVGVTALNASSGAAGRLAIGDVGSVKPDAL